MITDLAGTPVWSADQLPFGQTTPHASNTISQHLRFPGQYSDNESGLHYNWHRYYDPRIGRYLTADPIGLDGGMNVYGYVDQTPINVIDPEGLHGFIFLGRNPPYVNIPRHLRGPIRNIRPRPNHNVTNKRPPELRWTPGRVPPLPPKTWWAQFLENVADFLSEIGLGSFLGITPSNDNQCVSPCEKREPADPFKGDWWAASGYII